MISITRAREIVASFTSRSILVVGDLMLDRYVTGAVDRISPEAPVPVLRVTREHSNPGGAANVALNIKRLGADSSVAGYVGRDAAGEELIRALTDHGIGTEDVLRVEGGSTTVKTRVIAEHQQVVRVDREKPWRLAGLPRALWCMWPRKVADGPVMTGRTVISRLPMLKSWPEDGGGYVTLPQVYSESVKRPGFGKSNLGMSRVQLSGGRYRPDREVGLHYQIHRGIGPHHAEAIRAGVPLPVNIFVGGPPAMTLAAVMPLPEGMPEIFFAWVHSPPRLEKNRIPHSTTVKLITGSPNSRIKRLIKKSSTNIKPVPTPKKKIIR